MIKLAHTHWKLRKYTALAKTKAAQKEEDIQRQPSAVRRKKNGNDIPFGIRAIESGIEVDGVWISRSNTPANSTPGSPSLLANKDPVIQHPAPGDRSSTVSDMSRLEIPQPAHGGRPRQNPSRSSNASYARSSAGNSGGNPFERSRSSEASSSRPNSTYTDFAPRGRPTYQPRRASGLRYSNSPAVDNADALAHLEGRTLSSLTGSKSSNGTHISGIPGADPFPFFLLTTLQGLPSMSILISVFLMIRGLGRLARMLSTDITSVSPGKV